METTGKGIIIYGILNWGLGHATRSVPVIEALHRQGFKVVIASDGQALEYLKQVFPGNRFHELPAYNIRYGSGSSQLIKLGTQLPQIWSAARKERSELRRLEKEYSAVGVISDNRLGWYSRQLPSIYITHQLKLVMPVSSRRISLLHHLFINKYTECWVPDFEGEENIGGDLAHDILPKIPVRYIGPQSRFAQEESGPKQEKKYNIAVVLSGPEPQRTLLEVKLLSELKTISGNYLLIRGTTSGPDLYLTDNFEVIEMADAAQVKEGILSSEMVVSRSGYSSLMDYYFLGNQALLIPTPGQPEQEYLARYQLHKGRFGYVSQNYIRLEEDLAKAQKYPGFKPTDFSQPDWAQLFRLFEGK